jgi:hypothetical protein
MNIRSLQQIGDSELKALFTGQKITVIAGSGISIWKPTNLPSGISVGQSLFRVLFEQIPELANHSAGLEPLFRQLPFENIMEACPENALLRQLLKQLYNTRRYNSIHELLAQLITAKTLNGAITTNYDCCLEEALTDAARNAASNQVTRVVTETDALNLLLGQQVLFKIHGTADDVAGESLVFQLGQEGALPSWKRSLLHRITDASTLLIIGYSGLDFDICPNLRELNVNQIVWNYRSETEITHNARDVMQAKTGQIVIGDMRELLSRSFRLVQPELGSSSINLEQLFRATFAEYALDLWRVRILNSLSYGAASSQIIKKLVGANPSSAARRVDVMRERARSLHYWGAYKSSARTYEEAASIAKMGQLAAEEIFGLLLEVSDSWRCYGAFWRARKALAKAETFASKMNITRPDLIAGLKLKQILLLRRKYQFAELMRLRFLQRRIKQKAEPLFVSAAEALLLSGQWFNFQQLRLWADRFGFPPSVTRPSNYYEAPAPRQGYEHLGFPMAQMMVFRDEIDSRRRAADDDAEREGVEKAALAEALELRAEIWKLNYLLIKKFPRQRTVARLRKFLNNFMQCEYSPAMRVVLLLIRP